MSTARDYYERYQEMPRASQWIVLAALFLVVFLLWSQMLQPTALAWSSQADDMERDLQKLQNAEGVPTDIRNTAVGFGTVQLPGRKQQGSLQLAQNVQQVLQDNGITQDTFTMTRSTPINSSKSVGLTPGNEKLERLKAEVDFKARPEVAIKIISTLESDPAIEAITSVKLDKDENPMIRVRLTIESWVKASKGGRR
ncbi:MAG: hypothetical protein MK116_06715 [Phycisphaerales bacterium]|nr:hypothetical protein [Phycisphaerales bacterium]